MADNLVLQMAKLNITFNGENGDLPDLVSYDATDADIRQMATESVRYGYVPGIEANALANFDNFVVERYPAKEDVPFNRIVLRPKSEFGGLGKVTLSFKTPDVFYQLEEFADEDLEDAKKKLEKWVEYEEYVNLEFDLDKGIARVLPVTK